jgi:hypothetical protein
LKKSCGDIDEDEAEELPSAEPPEQKPPTAPLRVSAAGTG